MSELRKRETMMQASVDNPSFEYETNFVSRKDLISVIHYCGIGRPWQKNGKRGFIYESSDQITIIQVKSAKELIRLEEHEFDIG